MTMCDDSCSSVLMTNHGPLHAHGPLRKPCNAVSGSQTRRPLVAAPRCRWPPLSRADGPGRVARIGGRYCRRRSRINRRGRQSWDTELGAARAHGTRGVGHRRHGTPSYWQSRQGSPQRKPDNLVGLHLTQPTRTPPRGRQPEHYTPQSVRSSRGTWGALGPRPGHQHPLSVLGSVLGVGGGRWGVLGRWGRGAGRRSQAPQQTYLKMIPSSH